MKSTATRAQLTVYGKVSETFARTKPSDDLDDFLGSGIMKLNSVVYSVS